MDDVRGGFSFFSPVSDHSEGKQEHTKRKAPASASGSMLKRSGSIMFRPAVDLVDDAMRATVGGAAIAAGGGTGDAAAVGGAAAARVGVRSFGCKFTRGFAILASVRLPQGRPTILAQIVDRSREVHVRWRYTILAKAAAHCFTKKFPRLIPKVLTGK